MLQSPSSQRAGRALEESLTSITATNDLLKSFRAQFMAQMQALSSGAAPASRASVPPDVRPPAPQQPTLRTAASAAEPCEGRVDSWMETTLGAWQKPASGGAAHGPASAFEFAELPVESKAVPTPGFDAAAAPLATVAAGAHDVARQLFADPQMHVRPSHSTPPAPAATASSASVFETVMRAAEAQKAAAEAALASPRSIGSGTPAWAACLSERSAAAIPPPQTGCEAEPTPSASTPRGADDIESLQHSLASATREQQNLLDTLQAEFATVQERVGAASLELDMLRAELDAVREQVCSLFDRASCSFDCGHHTSPFAVSLACLCFLCALAAHPTC